MRLRTEYRRAADTVAHRISANSGDERILPLPCRRAVMLSRKRSANRRAAPAKGMHGYAVPSPSAGIQFKQTQMPEVAMSDLPISHLAAPPLLHVEMSGRSQCHPSWWRLQVVCRGRIGSGLFNLLRSVVVTAEIAVADDAHGDA